EPSRAADPTRPDPTRPDPTRRAEPSRAEPSRAEPSRAEPSRAEPSRAEPTRAEPTGPLASDASGTVNPAASSTYVERRDFPYSNPTRPERRVRLPTSDRDRDGSGDARTAAARTTTAATPRTRARVTRTAFVRPETIAPDADLRCFAPDSALEAFRHNPTDGSLAPPVVRPSAEPNVRTCGSSRTEQDYCRNDESHQ
ncbi:hypothetical protein RUM44_007533, partial [Polyplax serrata]